MAGGVRSVECEWCVERNDIGPGGYLVEGDEGAVTRLQGRGGVPSVVGNLAGRVAGKHLYAKRARPLRHDGADMTQTYHPEPHAGLTKTCAEDRRIDILRHGGCIATGRRSGADAGRCEILTVEMVGADGGRGDEFHG